jgi:hyperosmotically inducible protein
MNITSGTLLVVASLALSTVLGGCSKPPEPVVSTPAPAPMVGNVTDNDVTANVKTALQQNDSLKAFDIGVVTLKGDVRLSGMLDSQAQIDEALRIARAADGAHAVHDELTIKK